METLNEKVTKGYNSKKALKRKFLTALEQSFGIVTTASKLTGISRKTHYQWLQTDASYAEEANDIGEVALDFAESQLHKQIKDGEVSSTIFYLKTKGKKRGYNERHEFANVSNQSIDYSQLSDEELIIMRNLVTKSTVKNEE